MADPKPGDVRYGRGGEVEQYTNGQWRPLTDNSGQQLIAPSGGYMGEVAFPDPSMMMIPQVSAPAPIRPEETLSAILKFAPYLGAQQMREMERYDPRRADLAMQLSGMRPQQLEQELAIALQYMPQFQGLQQNLRTQDRASSVNDLLTLAPMLQDVRKASEDPATTALREQLMGMTSQQLAAGTQLSAPEARAAEQGFRSAEQARGLEGGSGSSAREAVTRALAGQNLQQQRMANAQSVLGQEYGAQINPTQAILGAPTTAQAGAQAQFGAGLQQPTLAGQPVSGQAGAQQGVGTAGQIYNASVGNNLSAQNTNAQMQMYANTLQFLPYLYSQM